jgi:hypothetical protein
MTIRFRYEDRDCGALLEAAETSAGAVVKCPRCRRSQTVPFAVAALIEDEPPSGAVKNELPRVGEKRRPSPKRSHEEDDWRERDEPPRRRRRGREELDCPFCGEAVEPECTDCPRCRRELRLDLVYADEYRLPSQRARSQVLSFAFGLLGIGLAIGAQFLPGTQLRALAGLAGFLLLWAGIGFGVAYKRFNLTWAWLGLLGICGLIILACLPDEKGPRLRRLRHFLREHPRGKAD